MRRTTRQSDIGGRLHIVIDDDGDANLAIDPAQGMKGIEFCTGLGGGRSPLVRKALVALFEAIELEIEKLPSMA